MQVHEVQHPIAVDKVEQAQSEQGQLLNPLVDPVYVVEPPEGGPLPGDGHRAGAEVEVDQGGGGVVQLLPQEEGRVTDSSTCHQHLQGREHQVVGQGRTR